MHQPVPLQEGRVSSVASGPCPEAFRVCSRPLSSSLSTGCLLAIMVKICNDCSCLWILRNHHQFCLFESTQLRGSFFSNLQLLYGRCLNLQCPTTSHLARMVLAAGIKTNIGHLGILENAKLAHISSSAPSCHPSLRTRLCQVRPA